MSTENSDMKALADGLYAYFEPKIKDLVKPYLKLWRAQVVTAPADGKIGVQFPFESDTITIPYTEWASTAEVGNSVWVAAPYTDLSNAVVFAKSDFAYDGGGADEITATSVSINTADGTIVGTLTSDGGEGVLTLTTADGASYTLTPELINKLIQGGGGGAVDSVNGYTGDVTGAQAVADADIAPSSVNVGGAVSLTETTDGRGVVQANDASGNAGFRAYGLTSGGGAIVSNSSANTVITLASSASGFQSNAGALMVSNSSGNTRAVTAVNTDGEGVLRLWKNASTYATLTADKIAQIGQGAVDSVNGYTGDVTGAQAVADADIAPSSVNVGGAVSLTETTDGRGVVQANDASGNAGFRAYGLTSGGGAIVSNSSANTVITLASSASGFQSNAGALMVSNSSGNTRAVTAVNTDGEGVLRLWKNASTYATLTADKIAQIGQGAVDSVNGYTGDVTGAQAVADADIAPSSVNVGGAVSLTETTDGRGVLTVYNASGTTMVKAYANSGTAGGEVDAHNTNGTATAKLYGGNSGVGGSLKLLNTSGGIRAAVGVSTGGQGVVELYDASGTAHTLTPALIDQIGTGSGSLTLLWTNPNWNSVFAAQTVSLNLSGYTAIMTVFAYATSVKTRRGTQTQLVDGATYTFEAPHTSGGNYWFRREVTASTTGVTFGTGGYFEDGSLQGGDLYTMPLYIYGIK